ncbi:hypothetical protein [Clavibacter capsici]|uniref:Uncharacterized protein n=1 Tax=Clavibacter capsici TaxID=1874630 RepID=A0AAE7CDM5_9MICO|nr:hypothetical protein [Clavibacter capsici]ALD14423.1 hypothetical protein AES38_15230 [Clavibacter capsici]QIS40566.1 hypothetical protein GW572_15445 [Clavibacter capsici]QIS46451.1 hypothetical protein GW570_14775 [Clavibacter capsici]
MDDFTQQLTSLGVQLTASAARNSASAITDKISAMRASKSAGEQVAALEQIVSELLADKSELTRIAQAYQQELVAQQLTPGDVHYITETIVPVLEQFADGMENPDQGAQFKSQIRMLKPLLSVETVNILQLLGFNFRQSIGGPLTQRLAELIGGSKTSDGDLQIEALRSQQRAMDLATDPEAYARFREMYPMN